MNARRLRPSRLLAARTPLALPGMRIGLLGGSFDPAHEAHRLVSLTALKALRLDRVWWLVTPGNPLKERQGLAPQDRRMRRARRTAADARIVVTGFEAAQGSAYTAETIAFLTSRHPDVRFVWIMGADNLAQFHRWRDWRGIAARVPFAAVDRPGWRLAALSSPAARALAGHRVPERDAAALAGSPPPAWTFLTGRLSTLSSTALRASDRGG